MLVATKGGHLRPGDGSWTQDGSARHLIEAAEASREALGVESIDLYQFHRPDPRVPFAESIGALNHLLDDGVILMAGLSNVDVDQIEQAMELTDGRIVSVQNQFSPSFRSSLPSCSGARSSARVPPLQPARRHRERSRPRQRQLGLPADRGRSRGQPAAGRAGVGAGARAGRDPDPGASRPRRSATRPPPPSCS